MNNKATLAIVGIVVVVGGLLFGHEYLANKQAEASLQAQIEQQRVAAEERAAAAVSSPAPDNQRLGAFVAPGFNSIDKTFVLATTTLSTNAQLVVNASSSRIYLLVQNDSDTDVYIYLKNFADFVAASTTVVRNNGIRLAANGGAFEILPENAYTGQIWIASTTVAGKNIIVTER